MRNVIGFAAILVLAGCGAPMTVGSPGMSPAPAPGQSFALPPDTYLGTYGKDSFYKDDPLHKAFYRLGDKGIYFEAKGMPNSQMAQSLAAERCMSMAAGIRVDQNECQLIAVDNEWLATPLNVQVRR